MAEKMKFARNYNDLSTDTGFQFEFSCDRCGTTYRSSFSESISGRASQLLGAAGSLFGGIFGSISSVGDRVRDASWKTSHDKAFQEAIDECSPMFIQCPHCHTWVCKDECWNSRKGLCKECAPDLGVEMAAAQSERAVEEIHAHAAMAEEDKHLATADWRQNIVAKCPECGTPMQTNSKFCPECGALVKPDAKCKSCGAKLLPKAKFCPECGEKV